MKSLLYFQFNSECEILIVLPVFTSEHHFLTLLSFTTLAHMKLVKEIKKMITSLFFPK